MIDIFSYLYLISKIPVKVTFGCLHWQLPEILEVNVTVQIQFFSAGEMAAQAQGPEFGSLTPTLKLGAGSAVSGHR